MTLTYIVMQSRHAVFNTKNETYAEVEDLARPSVESTKM